jgi:hypothetical protein
MNNFFPENHAAYEVMWKNMIGPDGPYNTAQKRPKIQTHTRISYLLLSHGNQV